MTVPERRVAPIAYEDRPRGPASGARGIARRVTRYRARPAPLASAAWDEAFGDDRDFPVDPIPRLIAAEEWRALGAGLGRRVRALDAFAGDLARERRAVAAGVVPERLAVTLPFLEPDLADVPDPAGARSMVVNSARCGGGKDTWVLP